MFSDSLKFAKVTTIFQWHKHWNNYGPISTTVFSKNLERIMYNTVYNHLGSKVLLKSSFRVFIDLPKLLTLQISKYQIKNYNIIWLMVLH